jgi:hypothetical protein
VQKNKSVERSLHISRDFPKLSSPKAEIRVIKIIYKYPPGYYPMATYIVQPKNVVEATLSLKGKGNNSHDTAHLSKTLRPQDFAEPRTRRKINFPQHVARRKAHTTQNGPVRVVYYFVPDFYKIKISLIFLTGHCTTFVSQTTKAMTTRIQQNLLKGIFILILFFIMILQALVTPAQ